MCIRDSLRRGRSLGGKRTMTVNDEQTDSAIWGYYDDCLKGWIWQYSLSFITLYYKVSNTADRSSRTRSIFYLLSMAVIMLEHTSACQCLGNIIWIMNVEYWSLLKSRHHPAVSRWDCSYLQSSLASSLDKACKFNTAALYGMEDIGQWMASNLLKLNPVNRSFVVCVYYIYDVSINSTETRWCLVLL